MHYMKFCEVLLPFQDHIAIVLYVMPAMSLDLTVAIATLTTSVTLIFNHAYNMTWLTSFVLTT